MVPGPGLLPLALLGSVVLLAGCPPLINDISTDRRDPPSYLVAPPEDPGYDAARLTGPTEAAYPAVTNLHLAAPPARVFAAVAALVAERGWRVAARDPEGGTPEAGRRLQAVAVTRWLRFRDDVVVRVRPDGEGGSVVAMRSKSRLGKGDLGANARRIRAFLGDLAARLGEG